MKFEIKNDRKGTPHVYFIYGDVHNQMQMEVVTGDMDIKDLLSLIAFFANYMKGVLK